MGSGEPVVVEEKSKSVAVVPNRGRKRSAKSNATVTWGKLLSQCSQVGFSMNFTYSIICLHVFFPPHPPSTANMTDATAVHLISWISKQNEYSA